MSLAVTTITSRRALNHIAQVADRAIASAHARIFAAWRH
jgi:hypothetical protein